MHSRADLGAIITFIVFSILTALMAACDAPPSDAVRFEVDLNAQISDGAFIPATDSVGLRGAIRPLSWDKSIPMKDPNADGVYSVEIRFGDSAAGQILDYKFKISGGHDEWETGRNRSVSLTSSAQTVARPFNEPQADLAPSYTGNIRFHRAFTSAFLTEARDIQVYLPPGYDAPENSERQYPVLYMHDGQNIFDQRSAGAEWNVDESAERLITAGKIEPLIIVGISSTSNRLSEYTPPAGGSAASHEESGSPSLNSGDDYGRMLTREVVPFINTTYRTLPGPDNTSLGGSSLGGLITLYFGLRYPDSFGSLLVVSPSVWWNDSEILSLLDETRYPAFQRTWVDIGTDEGEAMVAGARKLRDALLAKGWVLDENLTYVEAPAATHSERAWSGRMEDILLYLYATPAE